MGEEVGDEDLQIFGEFIGVIGKHTKEIKKIEDWLSEKTTSGPLKFEKVSDVSSVKLKAGVMSSVPLSFFSVGGKGMVSVFVLYLLLVLVWRR